jgi:hypothetical protein
MRSGWVVWAPDVGYLAAGDDDVNAAYAMDVGTSALDG